MDNVKTSTNLQVGVDYQICLLTSIIVQKVLDSKDDFGYTNDEYVDMFKTGIIDRKEVSRLLIKLQYTDILTTISQINQRKRLNQHHL